MIKVLLFIYNTLAFFIALPLFFILSLFKSKHRKDLFFKFSERFACIKPFDAKGKKIVWVHCASLGEVRAAESIIKVLSGDYFVVLTTITKSGNSYAEKANLADLRIILPIDLYPLMRRTIKKIRPAVIVLVETEFWPSMLYAAKKSGVKIVTINGRISEKSFKTYKKTAFLWKPFVSLIDFVAARTESDAERFKYLTAGKSKIFVTGNIKYDRDFIKTAFGKDYGVAEDDIIFTAGSTRSGEEEIIADAYLQIAKNTPKIKAFIAPRHLNRIEEVKKILSQKNIAFSLLSEIQNSKVKIEKVIIVDVFGKLQDIYSISNFCFVGGSLVNKGGQNPVEPAGFAKPVLFGESMGNFAEEAKILIAYNGAFVVKNASDIAEKIQTLINNSELAATTGENALEAVKSQRGALKTTIDKLNGIINETENNR